jgi:hypothetical protein
VALIGGESEEQTEQRFCAEPAAWSPHCEAIWRKFPHVLTERLNLCKKRGIPAATCQTPTHRTR